MRRNSFSERYELAVGCYTFELCLLRPYRNGSAIEVVSVVLAVVGKRCSSQGFDGEQGRGATNEGLFSGRGGYCLHSYILFTYFAYI